MKLVQSYNNLFKNFKQNIIPLIYGNDLKKWTHFMVINRVNRAAHISAQYDKNI